MKCDDCGGEVNVGDWPFCKGDPSKHVPARNFGEEPLEPYWDEHISQDGAYITTRAERRRIMYASDVEYKDVSSKKRGKFYIDYGR